MTDRNTTGIDHIVPETVRGPEPQNPVVGEGQTYLDRVSALSGQIVSVFLNSLPSNYVSEIEGPNYAAHFRAAAEELARIQIVLTDAYEDTDFDFTRSEVLFQFLGSLVFPDAGTQGAPDPTSFVEGGVQGGDTAYRAFLKRMVALLLRGSGVDTVAEGIGELTDAEVRLLERVQYVGQPGVGWTPLDGATVDIEVSKHRRTSATVDTGVLLHYHTVTVDGMGDGESGAAIYDAGSGPAHTHEITTWAVQEAHGTGQPDHTHVLLSDFATAPQALEYNTRLVTGALGPAHTLFIYRNLFREILPPPTEEDPTWDLSSYRYEDLRRDCSGLSHFSNTGSVLSGRYLFKDSNVSFRSIRSGAELKLTSGPNAGAYIVAEVLSFPGGNTLTGTYAYTTSPTGLTGYLTVNSGYLTDSTQNFGLAVVGETITIASGPNAGTYRLSTLMGPTGGPVGVPIGPLATTGPATSVTVHPSILRANRRFPQVGTGIPYRVTVDRLGRNEIQVVTNEDVSSQFYTPGGPFSTINVAHGPMVRLDGTQATNADVTVTVNAVPVVVRNVNPVTGTITLAVAQAGAAPGGITVLVSYRWVGIATFPIAGLGNPGFNIGRWDYPKTSLGSRFRVGIVLGVNYLRPQPVRIAHRYAGFEKRYTSALGSPTSLRLGNAPGRFTIEPAENQGSTTTISFNGTIPADEGWSSVGTFTGQTEDGVYTLTKPVGPSPAYWKKALPTPTSSVVSMAARFTPGITIADGVFSGFGFGFHDDDHLFFAGCLTVLNPTDGTALRHLGILVRPGELSDVTSWVVGPYAEGVVQGRTGSNVVTFNTSEIPTLVAIGDRFQVRSGAQGGTYTIADIYSSNGITTILTDDPFPANPELFGNQRVVATFEVRWDLGTPTWRLHTNTRTLATTLFYGGGSGCEFTVGSVVPANPSALGPDITLDAGGSMIWGSPSRIASGASSWTFVRGTATPDGYGRLSNGAVINTVMTADPEDSGWYPTSPFGYPSLASGALTITKTPASDALGTSYGYRYDDPFLSDRRVVALDAKVAVSRDTSGSGGASIVLSNGKREAKLGNILYRDVAAVRSIYQTPTISLVGSVGYASQSWVSSGTDTPDVYPNGHEVLLGSTPGGWTIESTYTSTPVGRFLEWRLALDSYTVGQDNRIGLSFSTVCAGKNIVVDYTEVAGTSRIVMRTTPTGAPLATYVVPWNDGDPRNYLIQCDGSTNVAMFVDGVSLGTTALASYGAASDTKVRVVHQRSSILDTALAFEATLASLCQGSTTDGVSGLGRTFGIWLGGDPSDINQWRIPRSDGTSAPNSNATSATPVSMDWGSQCWVRIFVDPTFGASFIRPDLSPPPGYAGDFATQSMNPSAGWVKVDYAHLPRVSPSRDFGYASFGALNPGASTLQVWDDVKYQLFTYTSTQRNAPRRMVLGKRSLITSGDYLRDTTPEVVTIISENETTVDLRACNIVADRVFVVSVDGATLDQDNWSFSKATQLLSLTDPLPTDNHPVSVTFAAGLPSTVSYLQTLPLEESNTILNEGTPPVPTSQTGTFTVSTVSGDGGPTPAFPPAGPGDSDYFLRDQYLVRQATDDPSHLYEKLDFFQLSDGGSTGGLSGACDNCGSPTLIAFSGGSFAESLDFSDGMGGLFAGAMILSGGSPIVGGVLGPAVYTGPFTPGVPWTGIYPSVLYPSTSGPSVFWDMDFSPIAEAWGGVTDQDYASNGPAESSPSIVGSVNGSVWSSLVVSAVHSRLGPWSGYVEDLAVMSLLYGESSGQPEGVPPSGDGMILYGGSPLPADSLPVVTIL